MNEIIIPAPRPAPSALQFRNVTTFIPAPNVAPQPLVFRNVTTFIPPYPTGTPSGSTPAPEPEPEPAAPPSDDPNLFSWHSSDSNLANDGVNVASGANAWIDRSGNTHTFGADPGFAPGYTASGPNGKPAIVWTDGSDKYFGYIATRNQPTTVYALVKAVTWADNRYFWDGANSGASAALIQTNTTPNVWAFAGAFSSQSINLTLGAWHVVMVIYDGANSVLQVDSTTAITGNFGASVPGGMWLGNYSGSTGNNSAGFQLAAVIVTSDHSSAEMQTLHKAWLAEYGGVTL